MKNKFLNKSKIIIKTYNTDISDIKMEEILYGLEGLYLTITKIIFMIILSIFLKITKEMFILLIVHNIIRSSSFGLHATKSGYCLIASIISFIGGAFLCKYIIIPIQIAIILSAMCIICLYKYAPADTHKRPIINIKRRKQYKIISTISGIIFTILIITFNSTILSNYLLIGMIESVLLIHPLVYKMFNLPFDNYKTYILNN